MTKRGTKRNKINEEKKKTNIVSTFKIKKIFFFEFEFNETSVNEWKIILERNVEIV